MKPIFLKSGPENFGPSQKNHVNYYVHDHLGNTRVTYKPTVTNCGPSSFDTTMVYAGDSCWQHNYLVDGDPRDSTMCDSLFTMILTNTSKTLVHTIEAAFDYYPYGKVLREYNASAEKYLTTHHERDEETGWDYRNARYSEADIPRFGQIDPAMSMYPSMSPYSYVGGNPISYVDPTGANLWHYEHDEDGNSQLVADEGDDINTLKEQYNIGSDKEAYTYLKDNGFGDYAFKSESPQGTIYGNTSIPTGTKGLAKQILKIDVASSTDQQKIDQILFAVNNETLAGNQTMSYSDYFRNVPSNIQDFRQYQFTGFERSSGNKNPILIDAPLTTWGSYGEVNVNPRIGNNFTKKGVTFRPLDYRNAGGKSGYSISGLRVSYPIFNKKLNERSVEFK